MLIGLSSFDLLRVLVVINGNRVAAWQKEFWCLIASGSVPPPGPPSAQAMHIRCMEGQAPQVVRLYQQTLLSLIALAVVALIIYVLIPTWKCRHRRLVVLGVPLNGGTTDLLLAELAELRRRVGIPAARVRFMLDPYNRTCSAVAFGRFGRNTIALNAGLVNLHAAALAQEAGNASAGRVNTELQTFRGVVLHELNHVANRDIGLTYATIAAWRAFLLVALVPTLILIVVQIVGGPADLATLSAAMGSLPLPAGVVAVVYLARADVLRVREYHADILPPGAHADIRGLLDAGNIEHRGWRSRLRDTMRRSWHPSNAARRRALDDPARLFRTNLVPIGLAGVAAAIIARQALGVERLQIATPIRWLTAVVMLAVVSVPIWRAALYAADHGIASPRGWREGTALGAGLVTGSVIVFADIPRSWLPHSPWLLGIVFAGAVVAGVWMAQLASLSAQRLPLHLRTAGFWTGQLTTVVVVGAPLMSFFRAGQIELGGGNYLGPNFSGVFSGEHWLPLPRAAAVLIDGAAYTSGTAIAVAGAALAWLLPAAILIGALLRPHGHPRLRTRRVLVLSVGGAVFALIVAAVINGSGRLDLRPGTNDIEGWLALAWLFAGLLTVSAVVAAIAAIVLPDPAVPYAVVVGGTSLLLGTLATATVISADGCLGPLNGGGESCTNFTGRLHLADAILRLLSLVLVNGLFGTIVAAVAALALQDLGRRFLRRRAQPPTADVHTRKWSPRAAIALAIVAAAVVAWAVPRVIKEARPEDVDAGVPQTPSMIASRTQAWVAAGGGEILLELDGEALFIVDQGLQVARLPDLTDDTTAQEAAGRYRVLESTISDVVAACHRMSALAQRAESFIPIPDAEMQSMWAAHYSAARSAGDRCTRAPVNQVISPTATSLVPVLNDPLIPRLDQLGAWDAPGRTSTSALRPRPIPITAVPQPSGDFMTVLCQRFLVSWQTWSPQREITPHMRGTLKDLARPGSTYRQDALDLDRAIRALQIKFDDAVDAALRQTITQAIHASALLFYLQLESDCIK
ncbi:hypothetical protein ACFYV7_29240 [Nocardia suismassiliense]|uniref:Peptidase M48 domain-containing protein n=1 Tax=Nocardia suismassiliense TaxID=2077092 RepID=A0ABW6R1E7_9NOCA